MKIAAFDIGTNTVLMLAAESKPNGHLETLLELSRITRLGKGVDKSGSLDPDAARRTLDTLVEFAEQARTRGVEKFVAVGTATLRDASDGVEFIEKVRERSGIEVKTISGEEEARLSCLAVVRGLRLAPASQRLLIVDIGGGSTEFIRSEPGRDLEVQSLQIGSVRLTERIIEHDPPTPQEAENIRSVADSNIDRLGWNFRPDVLVGIAGTVTTVCAVALEMEHYESAKVHGHRLARAEVSRVAQLFGERDLAHRKQLKGLLPERADVIFGGTLILKRIMERFEADALVVSDQGVRWGLVWRELEHGQKRS